MALFRPRSVFSGRVTALLLKRKEVIAVFYATENSSSEENTSPVNSEINYNETVFRDNSTNQFYGASQEPFSKEITNVLLAPVNNDDIEIKPDGLLYLPEIKYRRILNNSFGPGAWALIPRGESLQFQNEKDKSQLITREYALFCLGRYVSQAVGEHTFYGQGNMVYGKAMEAARSNALVRCCKDLGIASELWDPKFVMEWKKRYSNSVWCEHAMTSDKRKLWCRSDRDSSTAIPYPWKPISGSSR